LCRIASCPSTWRKWAIRFVQRAWRRLRSRWRRIWLRGCCSGASALFEIITEIGEHSVSEEEGVQRLEGMHQEMRDYIEDFKKRYNIKEEPCKK
jgi:uncharacterized protein (UPF0305 family)